MARLKTSAFRQVTIIEQSKHLQLFEGDSMYRYNVTFLLNRYILLFIDKNHSTSKESKKEGGSR